MKNNFQLTVKEILSRDIIYLDKMEKYVINPETGRHIKVGGPTYQRLANADQLKPFTKPTPKTRQPSKPISEQRLKQMAEMPARHSKVEAGRGSRTRGWSEDAPKKGYQRHQLKAQCGDRCFLLPETEGFPICPRCPGDPGDPCQCEIDCRGLAAAKIRAHQYQYTDLYEAIERLEQEKHCGTA